MANPTLTSGTHKSQELYAKQILKIIRFNNKLRNFCSTRYEGDLKSALAVQVPVRDTDPTLRDYNVLNGVDLEQSATDYIPVIVDTDKVINELLDGFEANVVPDQLMAQRVEAGAYTVGRATELDVLTKILASNGGGNVTEANLDGDTVYDAIVKQIGELKKKGLEVEELKVAISIDTETLLLTDMKYTNSASQIGSERMEQGVVAKIAGVEVIVVPYMASEVNYFVFAPEFVVTGDAFKIAPTITNITDGKHVGASALQARIAYFTKVMREETVIVSKTA